MNLISERHLLVDGDPLTYRFGIAENLEEAYRNLQKYLREVQHACGASQMTIFLTGPDCLKGYRYHLAKIKPYQGNRTGKSFNLPTRKALWNRLKEEGATTHPVLEADDMIVSKGNQSPDTCVILSPDKDLLQSRAPVWGYEGPPEPYRHYRVLSQILQGDRADNIPGLLKGWGPKKAEKFLNACETTEEALQGVLDLAEGDTLRLAEISSLVILGAYKTASARVRSVWGDMLPWEDLDTLDKRCQE